MRYPLKTVLLLMTLSRTVLPATINGTLITQIRGITDKVAIRCSSNPATQQQPRSDGSYSITVASARNDYILFSLREGDDNLYSPRIIRAADAGTDTLYIIPPTNQSVSIIVDNKTGKDFSFIVDKAIVLDQLTTSEKDYQLTVIPHRSGTSSILIAAMAPDYPAVVKRVSIVPNQQQGYFVIEPQDIGMAPQPSTTLSANLRPTRPVNQDRIATETPENQSTSSTTVRPSSTEPDNVKARPRSPAPAIVVRDTKREQLKKDDTEYKIGLAQSAYYFTDHLVLKDNRNWAFAIRGDYQQYPALEQAELFRYGFDLYNIKLFKNYFDISLRAANSERFTDVYYCGSVTWHHSSFASIDYSFKSAPNDTWYAEYDVAQSTVGVNGTFKSQGKNFQFGAGVRFQVDYGDFDNYFEDVEESKFRYLPSFYLISYKSFGATTATMMAGFVKESIYASVSILVLRHVGITYTFKNKSVNNSQLTPLENELYHNISLNVSFTIKKRE